MTHHNTSDDDLQKSFELVLQENDKLLKQEIVKRLDQFMDIIIKEMSENLTSEEKIKFAANVIGKISDEIYHINGGDELLNNIHQQSDKKKNKIQKKQLHQYEVIQKNHQMNINNLNSAKREAMDRISNISKST